MRVSVAYRMANGDDESSTSPTTPATRASRAPTTRRLANHIGGIASTEHTPLSARTAIADVPKTLIQ